jgi:hypothetical protein
MPADSTHYLLTLLTKPTARRLFYSAANPLIVDAMLLRDAFAAGVDLTSAVASRIKRPDGWTIDEALELSQVQSHSAESAPARARREVDIECVSAILTRPRRYVFRVGSEQMEIGALAVKSRSAFLTACLDNLAVVPALPSAREWEGWLAEQIEAAARLDVPEEATDEGDRTANVAETLRLLITGESFDDLMAGQQVPVDGYAVVNFTALRAQVQRRVPSITPDELRTALRDLGWVPREPFRLGNHTSRGWRSPEPLAASTTAAQRIAAAGNARRLSLVQDHLEEFMPAIGDSHD